MLNTKSSKSRLVQNDIVIVQQLTLLGDSSSDNADLDGVKQ
jgi:hypothetical protein